MSIPAHLIEQARLVPVENVIAERGIKLRGTFDRCGPCPKCSTDPRSDRFSINTRKQCFNCRGCEVGGDVIALVMFLDGSDFHTAIETLTGERTIDYQPRPSSPVDRSNGDKRALASAKTIIAEMQPTISAPIAMAYLERIRKIDTSAIADVLEQTDAIGWHPSVYFNSPKDYPVLGTPEHPLHGQRLGAIIGVMTDIVTAEPTGAISRTYLSPGGTKVGKAKTLGSPRGIIRLSPDDEVLEGLFIAEGIETALTGMANFGFRPTWSTGDRMLMADFPILNGIEALNIIVDIDKSGDGEKAAQKARDRWLEAGREVNWILPKDGDLNDVIKDAVG
jgi:Toprim domain-containing protein/CHC2-type zinc finger protein